MGDRKETDLHKPDGVIFQGEKVGHADKESRIRRRDGLIFKGEEIGYVDRQKNVRRPDGVIFKGDVVGKIKGTTARAQDGVIFEGEQWGYVDDDGNIRQRDGIIFRGRIIGTMRGHNKDAALGYYVLRFRNLVERFEQLEQQAKHADYKGKYIGKVRHMLEYAPRYDGLGDFDGLIRRLKQLEEDLVNDVERHRRSKITAKENLIREGEGWSTSAEWKTAGAAIKTLQARWKEIGSAGKDEDSLWHRFRAACDRFFERRTAHFEALDRQRSQNGARKEELCASAESLRHSHDLKAAVSQVKDLQNDWKTIGPAVQDVEPLLWDRFRKACDEVFAAAHRDWEHRRSEYQVQKAERERKHEEWERKQLEWRERMRDTLRAKRDQATRLRESIAHDEGNISRWRDTIDNLRPGPRADEIRDSLEDKISDVEDRVRSKKQKVREIEADTEDIEAKLRG